MICARKPLVSRGLKIETWLFSSPEYQFNFVRDGDRWFISSKPQIILDQEAVGSHIRALSGGIIAEFIDEPSESLRKALQLNSRGTENLGNISWKGIEGQQETFVLFKNNDQLYGQFNGDSSIVRLKNELASEMDKDLWDFQDKKLVGFDSSDATEVVIDGDTFVSKSVGEWVQKGKTKSTEHVRLLLVDGLLSATSDCMSKAWDLGKLQHTVNITLKDGGSLSLSLWDHPEKASEIVISKGHEKNRFYLALKTILENLVKPFDSWEEALPSQG